MTDYPHPLFARKGYPFLLQEKQARGSVDPSPAGPNIKVMQMKKVMLLLLLCSMPVLAEEPAHVYKQFGYSPPQWDGVLSEARKLELDECMKTAADSEAKARANAEKLSAIYGVDMSREDVFGAVLTGCLAEEQQGKGWIVQEKEGVSWKAVRARYAARAFMGLDPSQ
jgi:hypothetical protein